MSALTSLTDRWVELKSRFYVFFKETTVFDVCSDLRLATVVFLHPRVTPDASYLASVIRSRANIGQLINPLECSGV